MKHTFAERATSLGDPDGQPAVSADTTAMVSAERAADIRTRIRMDRTWTDPQHYGVHAPRGDRGTSHYCVADSDGTVVSATDTINYRFGSFVVIRGTGVVLNNELDDFAVIAGATNANGLVTSARNLIRPGRRPLSSMSPTLVLDGDA